MSVHASRRAVCAEASCAAARSLSLPATTSSSSSRTRPAGSAPPRSLASSARSSATALSLAALAGFKAWSSRNAWPPTWSFCCTSGRSCSISRRRRSACSRRASGAFCMASDSSRYRVRQVSASWVTAASCALRARFACFFSSSLSSASRAIRSILSVSLRQCAAWRWASASSARGSSLLLVGKACARACRSAESVVVPCGGWGAACCCWAGLGRCKLYSSIEAIARGALRVYIHGPAGKLAQV